jgi:GT2 family glycosyltransferase
MAALDVPPIAVHVLVNEDDPGGGVADGVRGLLTAICPDISSTVRSSTVNLGFAAGHNLGLDALAGSGADGFLVLNPDVVLARDCVRLLATSMAPADALRGPLLLRARPDTLAADGTIDSAGIRWTWDGRHLDDRQGELTGTIPEQPYQVAGISGACLFVTRSALDFLRASTGEFFDAEFLAYREDAELGLRASRLGLPSYVVPEARALHVRSLRGTSRVGVSTHVLRLGVRNRFLIAFKHGAARPGAWFGAPLRDVLVVVAVLLKERSSLQGLVDAWRLRRVMRAKGRMVRTARTDLALTERARATEGIS